MSQVIDALESDSSLDFILVLTQHHNFEIDYQGGGTPPIHTAISKRREDVALVLIQLGANVNLANGNGSSPLERACWLNLRSTAHALVQAGADIDNSSGGYTPLGSAARGGHVLLTRELLLWGADLKSQGRYGFTARQIAEVRGYGGIIGLFHLWGHVQTVWIVRSAEQIRRLSTCSALRFLPKDLCRMIKSMLV
jgi:hypothetical protein